MIYGGLDLEAMWPITWLVMFGLMLVLDYAWALYNQATVYRQPFAAGFYAVVIYGLGAFGILGYTGDKWLIIPGALGAFVGTFIGTRGRKAV